MGSVFAKSRVNSCFRLGLVAAVVLASSTRREDNALGQTQVIPPQYPTTGQGNGRPPFGQEPEANQDPMYRHAMREAAKKRKIERQTKLVEDSSRIVQLANELNAGIEPEGKEAASPAMSKKVEEIEKLARSVRELMKSE